MPGARHALIGTPARLLARKRANRHAGLAGAGPLQRATAGCGAQQSAAGAARGFSLHAATVCEAFQRSRLERLCRYITRPPLAIKRLSVDSRGRVVYLDKQPFRDGSTPVVMEPLDFMFTMNGMPRAQGCAGAAIARLAALVPRPRLNLTRFHSAGESDRTSCAQRKQ